MHSILAKFSIYPSGQFWKQEFSKRKPYKHTVQFSTEYSHYKQGYSHFKHVELAESTNFTGQYSTH